MPSIYDVIAESCAALAARTGRISDKTRLLQLADQWRTVPADGHGPGRPPPLPGSLVGNAENPGRLLARTPPKCPKSKPKKQSQPTKEDAFE
jgi:hypothetical protein